MAVFVVAHGAWRAGWAWRKVRPLIRAAGHEIFTPTHSGQGEREHLSRPEVNLDTHIQDVANVLLCEDLRDVVLIGHSYGGMVITGVAERVADRLSQLVYLDAFVPDDGQSLADLMPDGGQGFRKDAQSTGDGWRVSPNPIPPDTSPEDQAFMRARRLPQSIRTFEQPVHLTNPAAAKLRRTYIYCTRNDSGVFTQFATRFSDDPAWRYREIAASHNPYITVPEQTSELLLSLL